MEKPVCRKEGQPLFRRGKSPLQTLLKPCYVRQFGWSWSWRKGWMKGDCGAATRLAKRVKALASEITAAYSLTFRISCLVGKKIKWLPQWWKLQHGVRGFIQLIKMLTGWHDHKFNSPMRSMSRSKTAGRKVAEKLKGSDNLGKSSIIVHERKDVIKIHYRQALVTCWKCLIVLKPVADKLLMKITIAAQMWEIKSAKYAVKRCQCCDQHKIFSVH